MCLSNGVYPVLVILCSQLECVVSQVISCKILKSSQIHTHSWIFHKSKVVFCGVGFAGQLYFNYQIQYFDILPKRLV
jgi:hypothetical protein